LGPVSERADETVRARAWPVNRRILSGDWTTYPSLRSCQSTRRTFWRRSVHGRSPFAQGRATPPRDYCGYALASGRCPALFFV